MASPVPYPGELAGLATAFLWSLSAIAWSHAGRRIGAVAVATIRITLAAIVLSLLHAALQGGFWPRGIPPASMALLAVSGVVGACFGDILFFHALKELGPRLGMMVNCVCPALTALVAWGPPLREALNGYALAGMALTLGGVAWVVAEEPHATAWPLPPGGRRRGVLFALAGIVCFAFGYVLSRLGMGGHVAGGLTPFSAALVRVAAGAAGCWILLPFLGRTRATVRSLRDRRAMFTLSWGTIVGPVAGIWLSLVALDLAEAGVATALISTGPIFMIPLSYVSHRERPTTRGILGALIAVGGVFLLVLRHRL